ncbi:PAS domain S-box protein [Xanthocytophaga agilis]|uniref:histidine kinase n=1 Tax=Xanthocytophaga agilis TaxID=3048010 RepID=A0AAE3R0P2_9BACT|nr:PAS domain S-box protein [Xanthocytophaga agilis]MDJ1501516.1 PAS domain S-box protein [Xanthocytophaga agilis]
MLRLLLIEDSELDERILIRHLNKALLPFSYVTVDTMPALSSLLEQEEWDIIISDYNLPDFTGINVIETVKQSEKDIPIIIVSGNIGEETAVEAMHAGADDYLMKDNLTRLAPAIERAIREAENRRQKRQADKEIIDAKAQLEAYFNSSIQAIYLLDSSYCIQRLNTMARTSTFHLLDKEPQIGDSMLKYIPEELHIPFKRNILLCLQGEMVTEERLMKLANQKERWFQIRYSPVYDEQDRITRIAVSLLDITTRIKAEAEAKEFQSRLEGIIHSAMDAIITIDNHQKIVMINEAGEKMFGYTANTLLDQAIDILIPVRYRSRHADFIWQFGESKKTTRLMGSESDVLYGLHASGKEFPIEASISQVTVAQNRYYTVIIRDITIRVDAQEQERRLNRELIRQNEQLQQFGYITSHNIRGPVATLLGLMNLLQDEEVSEVVNKEIVHHIKSTLVKLDTVIRDLNTILEYHKPVSRIKEVIVLEDLCQDVCGLIIPVRKDVDYYMETCFDEVPTIFSVRSYIHSIFYNLISNAFKFRSTERKLCLKIKSYTDGNSVFISFEDNGLGIDLASYQDSIFGMHKRFHIEIEGKGLGLYLVKTQVNALNGEISLRSELTKGTTFIVSLPKV